MSLYLVTGAAGFIGSRFVEFCNQQGIPVVSVDEKPYFSERPEHSYLDFGTIVDRENLFQRLSESPSLPISAVIHMGACSDTMQMDAEYLRRVNVDFSKNLWSYCTQRRIPFIYASSAATYGAGELGYDDDEALLSGLKPLNEYGRSKQIFDQWVLQQEREGNAPPTWSGWKFFNVYGFGERHKGRQSSVILHAYEQITRTGGVKLFRSYRSDIPNGEQKRDFVSVEDVIEVINFALQKPIRRGIFNLGTGRAQSFLDLVRAVFETLGTPERIEFIDAPVEIRDKYQYFTQARMEKLRGEGYSRPFMDLREGAAKYIARIRDSSV